MTVRQARVWLPVTAFVALLATGGVALAGCDDTAPAAARPSQSTTAPATTAPAPAVSAPPVLVPGRPGEPAATRAAGQVRDAASPRWNSLDVWYVRMMIPHHEQALEMAKLAPGRAADPRVRAVADRIRAAQGPEVGVLRAWLSTRDLPAEVTGHDHGTMRGMQSAESMRQLAGAHGAAFDRLFVRMMTAHHQGAVVISTDLLRVGADPAMQEFANGVAVEQTTEICRMRALLTP
ncbi:DUF305 domain-containing protein [Micromonospora sp. WMMD975]|uniref:DUF305 domain-containing protein n=1 Tax=Micromonospora sp. WMMD975 TaxID=3016087 RepID=UPI002499C01B|nr:DUF305 domain-containing protein [Micromonospora sp. WMMD975]WFE35891.1 DUF305 domain-containing protein [Micromonospora sp. WMMD975]